MFGKVRESAFATNLETVRDHLVDEVGHLQIYDPTDFLGTVFPSVSNDELSMVKQALNISDSKDWISSALGGRPSVNHRHEQEVFASIASSFNQVTKAVHSLDIDESLVFSKDDPTRSLEGNIQYKTRPDACYVLKSTQVPIDCEPAVDRLHFLKARDRPVDVSWADVAGTDEYKRLGDENAWRDNIRKVVFNMCQVMAYDPCRRATFAFTYEDTRVRFWWCDRSGFLASQGFDYFETFDTLLRFWIAICKCDLEKLGYDTTMKRVRSNGQEQFEIEIDGLDAKGQPMVERYITRRWISNTSANHIVGRATRVWEVELLEPSGSIKVLKDCWIEHKRTPEGERYRYIAEWFQNNQEEVEKSRYFLTFYGDSIIKEGSIEDSTFESVRGGLVPTSDSDTLAEQVVEHYTLFNPSSQILFLNSHGPVERLAHHHKQLLMKPVVNRVHYRLLVNEVCKRIDEMDTFGQVLYCLLAASSALQVLQKMGLVHRDISIGNILFHEREERGILSDLEFCMEYDRASFNVHNQLTGTLYFMSDEVLSGTYYWGPGNTRPPKEDKEDKRDRVKANLDRRSLLRRNKAYALEQRSKSVSKSAGSSKDGYQPKFKYAFIQNYLHDAESLWWILYWFLLATRPACEESPSRDVQKAREAKYQQFFPSHEFIASRSNPRKNPFLTPALMDGHDALPRAYGEMYQAGIDMGKALANMYMQAELPDHFDKKAMDGVHEVMQGHLDQVAQWTEGIADIQFAEYIHIPGNIQNSEGP